MPQVAGIKKGFFNCWKNELLDKKKCFCVWGSWETKGAHGAAQKMF
jgi:hypothetical protein